MSSYLIGRSLGELPDDDRPIENRYTICDKRYGAWHFTELGRTHAGRTIEELTAIVDAAEYTPLEMCVYDLIAGIPVYIKKPAQ